MRYDPVTRLLHLSIAIGVSVQMLVSLVMVYPKPGRAANQWFEVHETLGLALLGVLVAHWLWSLGRSAAGAEPMMLFPWLSRTRMAELVADIRETSGHLIRFRLPEGETTRPLPAAIQGLGLLLALVLAASGAVLFFGMAPDGRMSSPVHTVKEVHEALAPLMWAYLVVHPALGVLHQLAGHRTLNRVFGFRS